MSHYFIGYLYNTFYFISDFKCRDTINLYNFMNEEYELKSNENIISFVRDENEFIFISQEKIFSKEPLSYSIIQENYSHLVKTNMANLAISEENGFLTKIYVEYNRRIINPIHELCNDFHSKGFFHTTYYLQQEGFCLMEKRWKQSIDRRMNFNFEARHWEDRPSLLGSKTLRYVFE